MSSFYRKTKHPHTGEWETAHWIDNFYGHHNYGVRFEDGSEFDPRQVNLVTATEDHNASDGDDMSPPVCH